MNQKIEFYADGSRVCWSDDDANPDGITFHGIVPVNTSALVIYLERYDQELNRLSAIRNSSDDVAANQARKAINKLNLHRMSQLDAFCKQIRPTPAP